MMNKLFTLLLAAACFTASAQVEYPYPWNPDADLDGWVSTGDLLELLAVFGGEFAPDSWETDSLSAAVVLDGNHSYFKCQSLCNSIEGRWRMADLDAFGRHFSLVEDVDANFWVESNDKLNPSDQESNVLSLYGPTGNLSVTGSYELSQAKRCLCFINSSPFVPSELSTELASDLGQEIVVLQESLDSLASELSSVSQSAELGALSALPVGTVLSYSSDSIPESWMLCDGSEIGIAEFQGLYNLIGTTFGAGDSAYWAQVSYPATTFNLPDLRGRVIVGQDGIGEVDAVTVVDHPNKLGENGGAENHSLTPDELPAIDIDLGGVTVNSSGGCYGYCGGTYLIENGDSDYWTLTAGPDSVSNGGGDAAHNNMQPYTIMNYIIKVE